MIKSLAFAAVVALIGVGVWFFLRSTSPEQMPSQNVGLPTAGSVPISGDGGAVDTTDGVAAYSVQTANGDTIVVNDFIHNGDTIADVVNPGNYVLAGSLGYCLADGRCSAKFSPTNFNISYDEKSHFFNVVLLKEPLAATRSEAEQYLLQVLGVTRDQMCRLNYYVGTSYWVNALYDSKNLGFSFCQGATKLP